MISTRLFDCERLAEPAKVGHKVKDFGGDKPREDVRY
jgi:hypothetical protein